MTRSCSCAIAYFIWKNQWSFDQAFELVSSKRRECDIPFDYEEYLREYENQCKGFRNEQIDRIETNCLITVTIPDDQSHEKVIAEVSRFTNKEKDIFIMKNQIGEGVYGTKEIVFDAFIPEERDEEYVEELLNDHLLEMDIHSVRIQRVE